jgi:hypothetical protein
MGRTEKRLEDFINDRDSFEAHEVATASGRVWYDVFSVRSGNRIRVTYRTMDRFLSSHAAPTLAFFLSN